MSAAIDLCDEEGFSEGFSDEEGCSDIWIHLSKYTQVIRSMFQPGKINKALLNFQA